MIDKPSIVEFRLFGIDRFWVDTHFSVSLSVHFDTAKDQMWVSLSVCFIELGIFTFFILYNIFFIKIVILINDEKKTIYHSRRWKTVKKKYKKLQQLWTPPPPFWLHFYRQIIQKVWIKITIICKHYNLVWSLRQRWAVEYQGLVCQNLSISIRIKEASRSQVLLIKCDWLTDH